MKFNKTVSIITAAALLLSPMTVNAAAESQKPVFPQFNKNEVNGTIVVNLPDEVIADIDITFDSPEGLEFSYYSVKDLAKGSYSFDIEGRDNTADDYRYYQIKIKLKKTAVGAANDYYMDFINNSERENSFMIPDKNDNPDTFSTYTYNISVVEGKANNMWDTKLTDKVTKSVIFYPSPRIEGDINSDGKVDGIDASAILTAYAKESVGKESGLTEEQTKAADINGDGKMDGNDASLLLSYYAYTSVEGDITIADFIAKRKAKS